MGLMDRVKAQATQLAEQGRAQAAQLAEQGKAKIDQAQANRRGDQMLRQLGGLVYADRTGRGEPDSQAKIDQLISDLSAFERENGSSVTADPSPQGGVPPQGGGSAGGGGGSAGGGGGSAGGGGQEQGGSAFGQSFFPGPDGSPPNG